MTQRYELTQGGEQLLLLLRKLRNELEGLFSEDPRQIQTPILSTSKFLEQESTRGKPLNPTPSVAEREILAIPA